MTDETDHEIEELRQSTDFGSRSASTAPAKDDEFVEDLKDALAAKQQKGAQRSVSIWDGNIAGLFDALDDHPERLEAAVNELASKLDRDVDTDQHDKSELLRLLILFGLHEGLPGLEDEWRDAVGEIAKEQL